MIVLPNNIAVIEGDANISEWIKQCGYLAHDDRVKDKILPWLGPGDVVVDAGAYIGSYAFPMWEKIQPAGELYAFEPNPISYEALKHNLSLAHCRNVALGREVGLGFIRHDRVNGGGSHRSFDERDFKMDIMPLDALGLEKLRLIKLDVEGMEPDVIAGGLQTIKRCRPVIFVEVNPGTLRRLNYTPSNIADLIFPLGYRAEFLEKPHDFANCDEQFDCFLVPNELAMP